MKIKNLYKLILILLFINIYPQNPYMDPERWKLVWQDDFNYFDSTKWVKANNCDHGDNLQLYINENVFTENGNLVLRLKKELVICPPERPINPNTWACAFCNPGVHQYTSGWVETRSDYYVQYGYIEARIKLPYGKGLWPAFWTWTGIPNYQEIDIFEMVPGMNEQWLCNTYENFTHKKYTMTTNLHLSDHDGPCDYKYASLYIKDYTQWHVYGLEWTPEHMIWYIDNYPVRYYNNIYSQFNARTSIIFDLATQKDLISQCKKFPQDMLIDYIRVYQLKN